jgi:hypothetical protein
MKKLVFGTIMLATASIMMFEGCNSKPASHEFTDADKAKITAWNKLFGGDTSAKHNLPHLFDQPIPVSDADICISRYREVYAKPIKSANYGIIADAYTYSINFGSYNLSNWLTQIVNNTNTVEIQIRLGLYTGNLVSTYNLRRDRLTAFLYPVDGSGQIATYLPNSIKAAGTSAGTYNLAGLQP